MKKRYFSAPYIVWISAFIVIPLLLIIYYSVTVQLPDGSVVMSTQNIKRVFTPDFLMPLWRSIYLAFISTFICLLAGYPIAYILSRSISKFRNVLLFLIIAPMWMNFLLRTYAWLSILENTGFLNKLLGLFGAAPIQFLYNNGAVMLGMVYNFLPFMILPIYSALYKMDKSVIEAAEDLGGNAGTVFRKVIFPLSMPGVISGITMVFMPAVTTFIISRLLGGGKVPLIGDMIEHQFIIVGDWHFGSALSMILMVVILLSISFLGRYEKENEGGGLF